MNDRTGTTIKLLGFIGQMISAMCLILVHVGMCYFLLLFLDFGLLRFFDFEFSADRNSVIASYLGAVFGSAAWTFCFIGSKSAKSAKKRIAELSEKMEQLEALVSITTNKKMRPGD